MDTQAHTDDTPVPPVLVFCSEVVGVFGNRGLQFAESDQKASGLGFLGG